jgi:putative membrane protein insertion efficiency factor
LVVLGFTFHRFTRSASSFDARHVVAGSIHIYQRSLSPLAARIGIRCRFTPTCSRYAEVVIQRDGVLRGGWLAVKRVARCGPWTTPGTTDEP